MSFRKTLLCSMFVALPVFAAAPTAKIDLPKDEKAYLERLHHSNQMEVELGKLAQEKAVSTDVKDFAKRMVTDHSQADEQLMTYAKTNKLTLGEPKPMNEMERASKEAHKAVGAQLKAMDGKMFESTYMTHMLAGHDATLMKLHAGVTQFPKAASLIQPLIPKVAEHRDLAYKIVGTLKPESTVGIGGSGTSATPPPTR